MALTTLDPKTELLVVDLQKGIIPSHSIHPIADVVERTRALLDAFCESELPVVPVNVAGGAPGRSEQPRRYSRLTEGFSGFLFVSISTGTGVEVTARQAYEQGFNVTLAADAVTDVRPEAHAYILAHVFARLGGTGPTREIINLIARRSI